MLIVIHGDDTNLERKNHMKLEKYKLKNGETRWRFQIGLPRDAMTGRRRTTRRSGFRTREQANISLTRLKSQLDREQKVLPSATYQGIKTFKDVYEEWLVIYKTTVKATTYFDLTKASKNRCSRFSSHIRYSSFKVGDVSFRLTAPIGTFVL